MLMIFFFLTARLFFFCFFFQTAENCVFHAEYHSTILSYLNFLQKWRKYSRIFHRMHKRWYQGTCTPLYIERMWFIHVISSYKVVVDTAPFVFYSSFWPLPGIQFLISFVPNTLIFNFMPLVSALWPLSMHNPYKDNAITNLLFLKLPRWCF